MTNRARAVGLLRARRLPWGRNGDSQPDPAAAHLPTEDLLGHIADIAKDLTKLEVNTILKPTISGGKMPKPRHALIDIAQSFCDELTRIGYPYPPAEVLFKGSYEIFHGLRERAKTAVEEYNAYQMGRGGTAEAIRMSQSDLYMLYRIRDLSSQLHEIMTTVLQRLQERSRAGGTLTEAQARANQKDAYNDYSRDELQVQYPYYDLAPDELATIRKIWEIGTEEIAMQTIIQLDGDVINRITPYYAKAEHAVLHDIHHRGVDLSMRYWGTLVGVVMSFFDNFVRRR